MIAFSTINIEGQRHLDAVTQFLQRQRPHVWCFQEVFADDAATLAHTFGAQHVFEPLVHISENYPHQNGKSGPWGIAIMSTFPIIEARSEYYKGDPHILPELLERNPNSLNRALLHAEIDSPDGVYSIATTHFTWANDGGTNSEQERDFLALKNVLADVEPDLLCGDFNSPRGRGGVFDELAHRYTDNIPTSVTSTIDPFLHRAGNLQLVVDGLFTTPRIVASNVIVHTGVSDHCAVTAQLSLGR